MLKFDGVWHFGEVFSSWMNLGFHCTGQMAVSMYGVVWVSSLLLLNVVDRVAHGGGGVMVWAGVCNGQRTQVHFIYGVLNAQRYRDKIPLLCHPLSMFGMLWIGVYDSVFQFLPISSNFTQPLKMSGPTFHRSQSTT